MNLAQGEAVLFMATFPDLFWAPPQR